MTYNVNSCAPPPAIPRARPQAAHTGLMSFVANRFALLRQRRALKSLDDAALHDIGLTREAAQQEARRPLWDAPENWRS